MIRIVGGIYRGKKLKLYKDLAARPTADRVKESIFNILGQNLDGLSVLDLFAGTGSLGIEALSRGAASAVFCDSDKTAIALVKENLSALSPRPQNASVYLADYTTALRKLTGQAFDVIFLDPPYKSNLLADALAKIEEYALLAEGGRIAAEYEARDGIKFSSEIYYIQTARTYGRVGVSVIVKR